MGELEPLIDDMARRRLSSRRRRRLAGHVRRAALDPRVTARGRVSRSLDRVPGIVDAARDLLAEELRGIVDADSRRFEDAVGPGTPDGILVELAEVTGGE
jgi:restriction endonuclease Mrr